MARRSSSPDLGPSARPSNIAARPSCRPGRSPWPRRSRRPAGCSGLLSGTADPARSGAPPVVAVPTGARDSTVAVSCFPSRPTRTADAAGASSRARLTFPAGERRTLVSSTRTRRSSSVSWMTTYGTRGSTRTSTVAPPGPVAVAHLPYPRVAVEKLAAHRLTLPPSRAAPDALRPIGSGASADSVTHCVQAAIRHESSPHSRRTLPAVARVDPSYDPRRLASTPLAAPRPETSRNSRSLGRGGSADSTPIGVRRYG